MQFYSDFVYLFTANDVYEIDYIYLSVGLATRVVWRSQLIYMKKDRKENLGKSRFLFV